MFFSPSNFRQKISLVQAVGGSNPIRIYLFFTQATKTDFPSGYKRIFQSNFTMAWNILSFMYFHFFDSQITLLEELLLLKEYEKREKTLSGRVSGKKMELMEVNNKVVKL